VKTRKQQILELYEQGKTSREIAEILKIKRGYAAAVISKHKKTLQQKKEPAIVKEKAEITVEHEPGPPPEFEVQPAVEEAAEFTMTVEDAEALYAAPAEVLHLILGTPLLPEDRIKLQGSRLYNFLKKHNIQLPYAELMLLITGMVADYGKIIASVFTRKQVKKVEEKHEETPIPALNEEKQPYLTEDEIAKFKVGIS